MYFSVVRCCFLPTSTARRLLPLATIPAPWNMTVEPARTSSMSRPSTIPNSRRRWCWSFTAAAATPDHGSFCGLNEKADKEGFIAVYPNGTGRLEQMLTWNGGNCCGYAMWNNVDDVGFTRALLDDLAKVANVDAKRVFATGMSNGGIMCYRLASELSDRIAAIAPVSGTMGTATCNPKRPVSVMHFHGTDDEFLPFKGGKRNQAAGTESYFYSVEHSIHAWVKADGCPEKPVVTDMPNEGRRWHDRAAEDLRAGQGRGRGRPVRHQRRRSHLAGTRTEVGFSANRPRTFPPTT